MGHHPVDWGFPLLCFLLCDSRFCASQVRLLLSVLSVTLEETDHGLPRGIPDVHVRRTALSDQGGPSTHTLHGAYSVKDRDSRPKVWYLSHCMPDVHVRVRVVAVVSACPNLKTF